MSCLLGGSRTVSAGDERIAPWSMMATMWDFMSWLLGRPSPPPYGYALSWRGGAPIADGYTPYVPLPDALNRWAGEQGLEGVWRAQSGEYWLLRGRHFILYRGPRERYQGAWYRKGNYLHTRLPWGEYEFAYRQVNDWLLLRDVEGHVMGLQRMQRGDWRW